MIKVRQHAGRMKQEKGLTGRPGGPAGPMGPVPPGIPCNKTRTCQT